MRYIATHTGFMDIWPMELAATADWISQKVAAIQSVIVSWLPQFPIVLKVAT